MNQVKFEVITDLEPIQNFKIEANFAETKAALSEMMAPYKTMVVTEETIPSAKTDMAKIRKIAAGIDEYRKAVKKAYTEPVKAFESDCKELTSVCDEAILNIDKQVKNFELGKKEAKKTQLSEYFQSVIGETANYLAFSDIYNPRWENATFSLDKAKEEINRAVLNANTSITMIRDWHSEFETELLLEYGRTRDLSAVLKKRDVLLMMKQQEEIRKERMSIEGKLKELTPEEIYGKQPQSSTQSVKNDTLSTESDTLSTEEEPTFEIAFKIKVTKTQMDGLKQYMVQHGIKPERI